MIDKQFSEEALELGRPFSAPVPGQSLTNSPEGPYPWEGAPQITSVKEAIESTFLQLIHEDTLQGVLESMSKKMPVADLASVILYDGFTKGIWNPDLMVMMVEPTMYMLIALADKAGIDYVLYRGEEEEDFEDDDEEFGEVERVSKDIVDTDVSTTFKTLKPSEVREESVTPKVRGMIEELDREKLKGLLSRSVEETQDIEEEKPRSLLEAGE
jgi:hypothetical protein|tara:strand:- start:631 stop:1269 length:639 start_codon:yes stop_codon:yes gene_type:complete